MNDQIAEPPVGAIVVNAGGGWPFIHAIGGWFRGDDVRRATWTEVYEWHQAAVDDPDDETTEPFHPIVVWPLDGVIANAKAEQRKADAQTIHDWAALNAGPTGAYVARVIELELRKGGE